MLRYYQNGMSQWRRHHHLFLAIAVVVGAPFFFWGGPEYSASCSCHAAWDLGHVLYFLLFTLWAHGLHTRKGRPGSPLFFIMLFILVTLLGSAVEFMQMFVDGRFPDMGDILRDQLGCLTAFAFCIRPRLFRVRWRQIVLQILTAMLLACAVWPLTRALVDECAARIQFPMLADFETPFECDRWNNPLHLRLDSEYVRHGRRSARLQLSTDQYSGISLLHFPRDWRGYQSLRFSVYNPEETPLQLYSRIHDRYHKEHSMEYQDRFHQAFTLEQGWNDLVISLDSVKASSKGRTMDMEYIEEFGLFVVRLPRQQVIYLDHIYLSK
jgi:VanZ like family.